MNFKLDHHINQMYEPSVMLINESIMISLKNSSMTAYCEFYQQAHTYVQMKTVSDNMYLI